MAEYITKAEYTKQKARLTRAKNSGDPLRVLDAVEKTLEEWGGRVWPDDWSRWSVALDDALFAFARLDHTQRLTVDRERFHAAFDRMHRW